MIKFAVIGDPIKFSLSPIMHNAMLKYLNIKANYEKILVNSQNLEKWINSNEALELSGFNVTMPLKNSIIQFVDTLSPHAHKFQAVNTIVRKENTLHAHNTDGIGFIKSLEKLGRNPKAQIAVLGNGGASNSLIHTLKEYGATVSIYCRNIKNNSTDALIKYYSFDRIEQIQDIDILINATPLGMYNHNDFSNFNFLKKLKKDTLVYDLIYNPLDTNLLKEARKTGLQTSNGIEMLLYQGIAALELFLDKKLDFQTLEKIAFNAIQSSIK